MINVTPPAKIAVLLLAYGGPNSLDDIPAYLDDIRGGRPTPQALIDDISTRYRLIGGRSPLLDITTNVARKLQERVDLPVYIGMRHWSPLISKAVAQMAADEVDKVIALCMAPHYSALSIGKYREKLDKAVDAASKSMNVTFVDSWHLQPDYLSGLATNIELTLARWPAETRDNVLIIFTAHSLPEYILEHGDPYDAQLRETAAELAQQLKLNHDQWMFCYQSAARTGIPWLGPQIEELVVELADDGHKNVIVAPIGFIADHVEVLYDIDIGVQKIARAHGIHVERPPMLNDSEPLISALAALVDSGVHSKVLEKTSAYIGEG